jgi:hypothetical protein
MRSHQKKAMSNTIQGLVWQIEFPNPIAKIIALKLADNANDDGGDIYPAVATVAHRCGVSRAAVCKWMRAMEHCGVLLVVERSAGGARTDTTERAYDVDLLRRLVPPKRNVPPELVLAEATATRTTTDKNGEPKEVTVPVLVVKPYAPPANDVEPAEGEAAAEAAPVHQEDGSDTSTRPRGGLHPSTTETGTRPRGGHEPFKVNPSITPAHPPLPPEGGWASGWGEASIAEVRTMAAAGNATHVATAFVAAVKGVLNPPPHVDGPSFVRQLKSKLARFDAGTLADAAEAIQAKDLLPGVPRHAVDRRRDLPTAADIELVCAVVAERRKRAPAALPAPGEAIAAGADPAVVARSGDLREALKAASSPELFSSWFTALVAERIEDKGAGREVVISAPSLFVARYVGQQLAHVVLGAAKAVFGDVVSVSVVQRKAPSTGRAA